ncbi:MAG: RNA polymerase subunit sigma-70 [Eubacteriales bacterium]
MTNEQRKQITAMRQDGFGYTTIAKAIGLSKENIKAYCRVHGLAGIKAQDNNRITLEQDCCLKCGKPLSQTPGKKKVKFCSSDCRQQWWNTHPEQVTRKALYSFTCACCGKLFTAYGNAGRKYCCHDCYIADRFKGGESHV